MDPAHNDTQPGRCPHAADPRPPREHGIARSSTVTAAPGRPPRRQQRRRRASASPIEPWYAGTIPPVPDVALVMLDRPAPTRLMPNATRRTQHETPPSRRSRHRAVLAGVALLVLVMAVAAGAYGTAVTAPYQRLTRDVPLVLDVLRSAWGCAFTVQECR
jgi:hypothetical protein